MPLQPHLCHRARRKGAEYWQVTWAAVRRECLRRRQLVFIGPPASVQFYKLPGFFFTSFFSQQRPLVSPPGMSPLGAVVLCPSRSVTGNRMDGLGIPPAWTK